MTAYAPETHRHRLHVHPWLVVTIVLAAALAGLGSWVIVDQTRPSSTQGGLASPKVTTMLHNLEAAWNRYDAEAMVAFYSPNAVMEEIEMGVPRVVSRGHDQLLARYRYMLDAARPSGVTLTLNGPITQIGPYVSWPTSWGMPGTTLGQGFVIDRLDENGKIAHEWVIVGAP